MKRENQGPGTWCHPKPVSRRECLLGKKCSPCHGRHLLVELVVDVEFGAVLMTVVLVLARICNRLVLYWQSRLIHCKPGVVCAIRAGQCRRCPWQLCTATHKSQTMCIPRFCACSQKLYVSLGWKMTNGEASKQPLPDVSHWLSTHQHTPNWFLTNGMETPNGMKQSHH